MLERIDHVNIVVKDLEKMVEFYSIVLGLAVTKRVTVSGDWVDAVTGLKGVNANVVYLDLPNDNRPTRMELIHYRSPEAINSGTENAANFPGFRHIAFAVDDIDSLVQRLRQRNVHFLSDVLTVPNSQVTYARGVRKRIVYFRDPEENLLELCEYR